MEKIYKPQGVCSREMRISIDENGVIEDIAFVGGCDGNTKGVRALAIGMHKDEVIKRLEGIDCKGKGTSCPDQLARALKEMEV